MLGLTWMQDGFRAHHELSPILSLYSCMLRQHQPGCVTHPGTFIKFLLKHYPKNKQKSKIWLVGSSYGLFKHVLLSSWDLTVWLQALWCWKQTHRITGIRDSREKLNWSGCMKVLWCFSYCTCLDFEYNEPFTAVVNRHESFHELTCFLAKASSLWRIKCALLLLQGSNEQLLMSH